MEIRTLLAYSDNCRALLRQTLAAAPELFERPIEPPPIQLRTIRQIAAHMAGAEERWIRMRIGGEELEHYETRSAVDPESLFRDWDRIRKGTRDYLDALPPGGLSRSLTVAVRAWSGSLTIEQILFHIVNHETHHRGQISLALQQFGLEPPDFDFPFLKPD